MATRFRLPSTGTPAVSPATQSYTHATATRVTLPTTDSSALTNISLSPDAVDHLAAGDTFFQQFVSLGLGPQTFTIGDAFKFCVQVEEVTSGDNLRIQVWIGIFSSDGLTQLAELRSKVTDASEVSSGVGNMDSRFLSSTLTGGYTTTGGERLVVEFSLVGTPTASAFVQGHNGAMRFGSNGASGDLPEADSNFTLTFNPWLEFANTINFGKGSSGVLAGGGASVSGAAGLFNARGGVAIIRYLLANNANVLAIVPASRISSGDLPINTTLPAIAVTQISGLPRLTIAMTERPRLFTDRVQVSALCKGPAGSPEGGGYPGVKALINKIILACPNQHGELNGHQIDSILHDIVGPDLQDDATSLFSQSVDFIVKWHSP